MRANDQITPDHRPGRMLLQAVWILARNAMVRPNHPKSMNPILAAVGLSAFFGMAAAARADAPSCWVYFGTQSTGADRGLYVSKLNQDTGFLTPAVRVADKPDSVFMAFSPDRKHLYSLAEVPRTLGRPREAIETYEVDAATGALRHVGERVVDGSEACHISVDPSGRCVLTANYDGQYVEVFPVLTDSTVGERSQIVRFSGSGPDLSRQQTAHPHSINVDPTDRFAIVCDLGVDRVYVYRLDAAAAKLSINDPGFATVPPGSGPRHFAFHPDRKHAFVIDEMGGAITAFNWDAENGVLKPYQTFPILRQEYRGLNTSAEVVVSKSGRFVYGSNRGDDSVVVLSFDPSNGTLAFVQRMADGVKVPRNYAIDPSGKWLVCANLAGNTATVYTIDAESGRLSLKGTIEVPESLCVRFLPVQS
jgi:6-phosphogluconolactonase